MRVLYNKNKWLEIYANPKYQEIRNKILKINFLLEISFRAEEVSFPANIPIKFSVC